MKKDTMSTFRKLAREAVIVMLLGPFMVAPAAFLYLEKRDREAMKVDVAREIHAVNAAFVSSRFKPESSVLVPLTNGVQLLVTDCGHAHSSGNILYYFAPTVTLDFIKPIPPDEMNDDCFFFYSELRHLYGPHGGLISVPLGNKNQVAIEEAYWAAQARSKHPHLVENAIETAFLSLWGFPAGIILWSFYRLVWFALKG